MKPTAQKAKGFPKRNRTFSNEARAKGMDGAGGPSQGTNFTEANNKTAHEVSPREDGDRYA